MSAKSVPCRIVYAHFEDDAKRLTAQERHYRLGNWWLLEKILQLEQVRAKASDDRDATKDVQVLRRSIWVKTTEIDFGGASKDAVRKDVDNDESDIRDDDAKAAAEEAVRNNLEKKGKASDE